MGNKGRERGKKKEREGRKEGREEGRDRETETKSPWQLHMLAEPKSKIKNKAKIHNLSPTLDISLSRFAVLPDSNLWVNKQYTYQEIISSQPPTRATSRSCF